MECTCTGSEGTGENQSCRHVMVGENQRSTNDEQCKEWKHKLVKTNDPCTRFNGKNI